MRIKLVDIKTGRRIYATKEQAALLIKIRRARLFEEVPALDAAADEFDDEFGGSADLLGEDKEFLSEDERVVKRRKYKRRDMAGHLANK